jgi:hypothetical protein
MRLNCRWMRRKPSVRTGKNSKMQHMIKDNVVEKAARAVLKIEQNIEEAVYIKQRRDSLLNARMLNLKFH